MENILFMGKKRPKKKALRPNIIYTANFKMFKKK